MKTATTRRQILGGIAASTLAAPALMSTRAFAQGDTIRIGCMQTLTGPVGDVGFAHIQGARIAVEQLNRAGGVAGRTVELIERDTTYSAATAVTALREFTGNGTNLIIGDAFTAPSLATVPLIDELGATMVLPTNPTMTFTHEGFTRNFFRCAPNTYMQYNGQATYQVQQTPDVLRWGGIHVDGKGYFDSWNLVTDSLTRLHAAAGREVDIVNPIIVKSDNVDFRVAVNQLLAQNLQGLIVIMIGGQAVSFMQQAVPFGLLNRMEAIADTALNVNAGPLLGDNLPGGLFTYCLWTHEAYADVPMAQALVEDWAAIKEGAVNPWTVQAHTAVMSFAASIEAAGSTETPAVVDAMEAIEFDSAFGTIGYRPEDHQIKFSPGYARVAKADNEQGWAFENYEIIPFEQAVEPASPGEEFTL